MRARHASVCALHWSLPSAATRQPGQPSVSPNFSSSTPRRMYTFRAGPGTTGAAAAAFLLGDAGLLRRNSRSLASGMGPSTRPCTLHCSSRPWVQQKSEAPPGALAHWPPRPPAQMRAMQTWGPKFTLSGVKRLSSGPRASSSSAATSCGPAGGAGGAPLPSSAAGADGASGAPGTSGASAASKASGASGASMGSTASIGSTASMGSEASTASAGSSASGAAPALISTSAGPSMATSRSRTGTAS
mmetsp:Transcript_71485/g.209946  ORF Transcript_71485/g.209946 Transcript_71485/m.209946 type:complete len:245 (+) Transcript_71485:149-883(+)